MNEETTPARQECENFECPNEDEEGGLFQVFLLLLFPFNISVYILKEILFHALLIFQSLVAKRPRQTPGLDLFLILLMDLPVRYWDTIMSERCRSTVQMPGSVYPAAVNSFPVEPSRE